jgi:serine/threonine protein kinase
MTFSSSHFLLTYIPFSCWTKRDLKPSNVGFKADDTVQLFDFGLCRELPPAKTGSEDETFLMSGVGTRRYMAPELVNTNCYNLKADCFSWAMLVVEMLTLNKPYPQYSSEEHAEYVCKRGERPVLTKYGVPLVLQQLLEQAWAHDVRLRLPMKEICYQLQSLSAYSDEELSQMPTAEEFSSSVHSTQSEPVVSPTAESSPVYFEFPPHFQHLVQDCEILSEYSSDMDGSCMDLTLTTTASTTWQDSVSTFF